MNTRNLLAKLAHPNPELVTEVLVMQLGTCDEALPDGLRAAILGRGESAVVPLLRLIGEEASLDADWGAFHAVGLLCELGAKAAIAPMLRILVDTLCTDEINERVVRLLPRFGQAVVEPALALLEPDLDEESLFSVCEVLSRLRVRDDRIFAALTRAFEGDSSLGAICFKQYGDERALPLLETALESHPLPRDPFALRALIDAYRTLSGRIPERFLPATGTRRH